MYKCETGRKLKERMKEHKDDGEKLRKHEEITGLSQHLKTTGHSLAWDDAKLICRETDWKKRKYKETAVSASHNKKQLMNEKDEIKAISNLLNIILNHKT